MKRLIRFFVIVVLPLMLSAGFAALAPKSSYFGVKGTVVQAAETKTATEALNLRTGPGIGYRIILTMPKGASVSVTSTSNGWSKVTYSGTTGYASTEYLTSPASSGTLYSVISQVNLRTGPGTSYSILMKIPQYTIVTVHSISGNWHEIVRNAIRILTNQATLMCTNWIEIS